MLVVSLVKKIEVYFQTPNFGHDNLISLSGINREFDFGLAKSLFKSHFTILLLIPFFDRFINKLIFAFSKQLNERNQFWKLLTMANLHYPLNS